eukprot:6290971-Prymnesium_polylepis.1
MLSPARLIGGGGGDSSAWARPAPWQKEYWTRCLPYLADGTPRRPSDPALALDAYHASQRPAADAKAGPL